MIGAADRVRLVAFLRFDLQSVVPHYQQLEDGLLAAMRQGVLSPGEHLPSEREMAQALGISRMTVRRAFTDLEARGELTSHVGKGWYVSAAKVEQQLYQLTGFSTDMRALGFAVKSEVLDFYRVGADEQEAQVMRLAVGAPLHVLRRRRVLDGEPIGLEHARIAEQMCPGLERFDFGTDSLYRVMRQEYGLTLAWALQQIEASRADWSEAVLLAIEEKAPVLRSTRTVYTPENVVVEYSSGIYRGDRYKYRVRLEGATYAGGVV